MIFISVWRLAVASLVGLTVFPGVATAEESIAPRPEKLPVASFATTPFMSEPKLSPDGDRIVTRFNIGGESGLVVLYPFDQDRQAPLVPIGKYDLLWYDWAGNDRVLVGVGYGEWYTTGLALYEIASGTIRNVSPKRYALIGDDVLHVADDGSYILVAAADDTASYPAVYRIDLTTGAQQKIVPPRAPVVDWYADSDGVVRLGLGYAGRRLIVVYRRSEGEKFKTIAKLKFDDFAGDVDTIRFRSDSDNGFVVTNAITGRFALYEFNWSTGDYGSSVFEHPAVDLDDVIFSRDGRSVEGVVYTDDRERVLWLDADRKELQEEIDEAFPDSLNRIASRSRDATRFIVWTGAAHDPGHFYFYHRPSGKLTRLSTPMEALRGAALAPVAPVSYRSRDGLEIPAYLTLPPGREPRNLPLIMLPHGGPHVRDDWRFHPWVQFLANRGYAVLQPNFRGSAGYGKDYLEKGFGQWGTGMQDDLTDGVNWLVRDGVVDPGRVCIMGASYGGYAALMGAIRTPELYRCAISFAGVTDVPEMMKFDRRQMIPARYRRWREMVAGTDNVDLKGVSPVNRPSQIDTPLLLAHGRKDNTVPFRQAEKMAKALEQAGKDFEYLTFDDSGHNFQSDKDHIRFLTAVDEFLARHNPAD